MESKIRVLVADDDESILFALQQFITRRGSEVELALDGEEALNILREKDFDVLLSDISMPGMDGLTLAAKARELRPETITLIMSGAGSRADLIKAMQAGVFDFLDKPFPDLATLGMVLERAGQQSRLIRERNDLVQNLKRQNAKLHVSLGQLHDAYGRLRQQEQTLLSDLMQAQRVQRKLLPPGFPRLNGLELYGFYAPCERLGGDFFGMIPIGKDLLALYLTDVAGHGVSAAMITVILRELIHARLMAHSDISVLQTPEKALSFLNKGLLEARFDPPILATMVYTVFDLATGTVRAACAGHPPPVLVRRDGTTRLLSAVGTVLGMDEENYTADEVTLREDDHLLLYSDGLPESRDIHGVEWTEDGMQETLRKTAGQPLRKISENLEAAMAEALRGHPAADDRTFLIAMKTPAGGPATINTEEILPGSVKLVLPERIAIAPPAHGGYIAFGWTDHICVANVIGAATWQQSQTLRGIIEEALPRTSQRVHLDMGQCQSLDSTMLGLLYQYSANIILHEPGKRVLDQLAEMGILNAFNIIQEEPPSIATEPVVIEETTTEKCSDLILSAHESLMEVSKENRERFGGIIELIKHKDHHKDGKTPAV